MPEIVEEVVRLVDTITISQDTGGPFPVYKTVTLYLWSDGTVDWKPQEGVIFKQIGYTY